MYVKLKIELSNGGYVVSLDEFTKAFLEAIQRAAGEEFQRLQIPHAPPHEPASASVPESRRALAVSKTEACLSPNRCVPQERDFFLLGACRSVWDCRRIRRSAKDVRRKRERCLGRVTGKSIWTSENGS